jgi:hypothetical protein
MNSLYGPLLCQGLLTFVVWFALVFYRVYVLQTKGINPQVLANEAKNQEVYRSGVHLSDHFKNLFEVPVLFFTGILPPPSNGAHGGKAIVPILRLCAFASRTLHHPSHRKPHQPTLWLLSNLESLLSWNLDSSRNASPGCEHSISNSEEPCQTHHPRGDGVQSLRDTT